MLRHSRIGGNDEFGVAAWTSLGSFVAPGDGCDDGGSLPPPQPSPAFVFCVLQNTKAGEGVKLVGAERIELPTFAL